MHSIGSMKKWHRGFDGHSLSIDALARLVERPHCRIVLAALHCQWHYLADGKLSEPARVFSYPLERKPRRRSSLKARDVVSAGTRGMSAALYCPLRCGSVPMSRLHPP
jgi:hypothetical protein